MSGQIAELARTHGRSGPLRILYPQGCLANLRPVVEQFRKLTGFDVDLLEASTDEISAEMILVDRLGTGTFDVAIPATYGIPDLVEAETIMQLDDFAARFEPPGLQAKAIYTLGDRYRGRLYGYQTDGDAYLMFYNRRWLEDPDEQHRYEDRHGRQLRVPLTWTELDRQLEFFHRPDEGRFGGSLFRNLNHTVSEFWTRIHARGLFPVDEEMTPRFDQPAVLEALDELVAAGRHLHPGAATLGLSENWGAFADGSMYANSGWGGTQKVFRGPDSKIRDGLAYGPMPGGIFGEESVAMPYFNWGWNYVVSSRASDPQLAYLFVLFAITPHISTLAVREQDGFFDPFREEHYADPTIREVYGDEFLTVHRWSMANAIPDFYMRGRGRYIGTLKHALSCVLLGQMDPRPAMRQLVESWERLTDDLGRDSQASQWSFLRASYPERLLSILE